MPEDVSNSGGADWRDKVRPFVPDLDWHSFFAGLTFVAALVAGGRYIHIQAASGELIQDYSALLVSLFIGTSTGHYLGLAIEERDRSVSHAYLGAFILLFMYWLYQNRLSYLSLTLVLMSISLFLAHDSLISDSERLQRWVDYLADGLSPVGVILFGALKFVAPAVPYEAVVRTVISGLTQEVNIFGAKLNVILFLGIILVCVTFVIRWATPSTESENTDKQSQS